MEKTKVYARALVDIPRFAVLAGGLLHALPEEVAGLEAQGVVDTHPEALRAAGAPEVPAKPSPARRRAAAPETPPPATGAAPEQVEIPQ